MDATLAKGLAVLEWLVRQGEPQRVTDVAQHLGLARSNAHRTLQTLLASGWVQQDANSCYRPTLKLFELGALVDQSVDLRTLLHPHLAGLALRSGETIHLAVLDGADIVYLDKFDSPLPVAAYSRIGGRAPAHCVASGKALLAALGPEVANVADLAQRLGPLAAHTPHTITQWPALQDELLQTRARGYAVNREEWRLGVCGLGVPVFDARGQAVAAVGMSVPSIRFSRAQVKTLATDLMHCALQCGRSLGYNAARSQTR